MENSIENRAENQELEKFYPEIYNIIYPEIKEKCEENRDKITEETISKMTNEIYIKIQNEKKGIISQINTIDDEQDTEIIYFLGQELTDTNETIDQYKENISKVTKEQIQNVASKVEINTIYFLRN